MARLSISSKAMLLLLVLLYWSSLSHLRVLAETHTVEWEVGGGDKEYLRFTKQSLYALVLKTCVGYVQGLPKLQTQQTKPGYNMLHVKIKSGNERATLAIKPHNLYLVGFQSQAGDWFAFEKEGHLLPGSKELSFNNTYRALTGTGNIGDMAQVLVGKAAAAQATSILARYKAGGTAMAEQEVRKAMAMFVLVVCEAERFTLVRDQVVAAWNDGGHVTLEATKLFQKWKQISRALIAVDQKKKWDEIDEAKAIKYLGEPPIVDAASAKKNLVFVLQASDASLKSSPF